MDSRLEIKDAPRAGTSEALATAPLVTIAWRLMRTQHRRMAEERRDRNEKTGMFQQALVDVATLVHRLRKTDLSAGNTGTILDWQTRFASQLEEALGKAGVTLVAPEGRKYTADLMEILENVAPLPKAGVSEPEVYEVMQPAVLQGQELLQTGKAVIAVPMPTETRQSAEPADEVARAESVPSEEDQDVSGNTE